MAAEWRKHCPYDDENGRGHQEAWRKGWFYRKSRRPLAKKIRRRMSERPPSCTWLQGYAAANEYFQEAEPEAERRSDAEKQASDSEVRQDRRTDAPGGSLAISSAM